MMDSPATTTKKNGGYQERQVRRALDNLPVSEKDQHCVNAFSSIQKPILSVSNPALLAFEVLERYPS